MEAVVTVAIIAVLSVSIYASYPEANAIMGFNLTSQEVMARIKNAQMYGSSQGGQYAGQGIYVRTGTGFNNTITEFLDKVSDQADNLGINRSNKYYDTDGTTDGLISKDIIKNSIIIDKICIYNSSNIQECDKNELSVTFVRPDTTAYMFYSFPPTAATTTRAMIQLKSNLLSQGKNLKCIDIYQSGQINIINRGCQ